MFAINVIVRIVSSSTTRFHYYGSPYIVTVRTIRNRVEKTSWELDECYKYQNIWQHVGIKCVIKIAIHSVPTHETKIVHLHSIWFRFCLRESLLSTLRPNFERFFVNCLYYQLAHIQNPLMFMVHTMTYVWYTLETINFDMLLGCYYPPYKGINL